MITLTLKEAKDMCLDNYNYFKSILTELRQKYEGKFVVIYNESIWGVFDSFKDAYYKAKEELPLGSFIVQQCVDQSQVINHFYSNNVVFV